MDQLTAVGLYLNLLPVRLAHQADQSFVKVAKDVQSRVRKALAHSRVPFDVLLEQLNPERSMTHSPIFQAFIDYKPPSEDRSRLLQCEVSDQEYEVGQTAYDITLSITDQPDNTAEIIFQLQESLYSAQDARVVLDMYMWLLEHFLSEPETTVGSAPLLSPGAVEEVSRVGQGQ
jgi:hybrid polyketide synthase/nonribosomal peptide synthetase ACE1